MKKIFFKLLDQKIPPLHNFLLCLLLFLLPWQTRLIFSSAFINGSFWEYGSKSLYASELLVWTIIALFILDQIRKKVLPSKKALLYCLIVILFFSINIFFSTNRDISLHFTLHIVQGLGILFVMYKSNISTTKLLTFLWAGGVLQGIFAFVQFLSQRTWSNKWFGLAEHLPSDLGAAVIETAQGRWLRAYGSFGWPNSLGIYLGVVWIIGIILYLKLKEDRSIKSSTLPLLTKEGLGEVSQVFGIKKFKILKILFLTGQFFILIGLLFSFSRSAWLSTLVGFAALGIFILKTKREVTKIFLEHAFYSVFLILSIIIIFHFLFFARFNLASRLENRSLTERTNQLTEFKTILKTNPKSIFVGLGMGTYTSYLHQKYPKLPVWELQPIHNIYALSFIEIGLLFSCFHVFMFLYFLKRIVKYTIFFLSPLIVLAIAGLFDHWMWTLYTGQLLWFIMWGFGIKKSSKL